MLLTLNMPAPRSGGREHKKPREAGRKGSDIIRANLKTARKTMGMTQKQVAEYLGVTILAYKRIEYGDRDGRISTWDKLEDLFGIHQRILREDISTDQQ